MSDLPLDTEQQSLEMYGPWGPDGVPEPVTRLVMNWFVKAYDQFSVSDKFSTLSETEQALSYAIVRSFVAMMLVEVGETPNEWSPQGVRFALDELLPHDLPQSRTYEFAFVPVTLSFIVWLDDINALPAAHLLANTIRPYIEEGHLKCDCAIRSEALEVAERVMQESDLDSDSLLDTAVYIAKYTETLCGEMEQAQEQLSSDSSNPTMVLNLMCPCGSGKQFDVCCGGVN